MKGDHFVKMYELRKNRLAFLMFIFFTILFAACSNQTGSDSKGESNKSDTSDLTEKNKAPVTIKIAYAFGEESFHGRFDHIDEKLENIEIEYVPYENTLESLQEIYANNVKPDIIIQYNDMTPVKELDVIEPIDDLAVKHGLDLETLRPSLVAYIRSLDEDGKMIGLPDGSSHVALYYNKEIFDLFGVEYPDPEKSMTWDEVFALAKQMTGERNGLNYVGFEFAWGNTAAGAQMPLREFAINMTDPETGEFLFDDRPEFKQYFNMMDTFYNIPDIYDPETEGSCLFCEKRAAMSLASNLFLNEGMGDLEDQDSLDMLPTPVWADAPDITPYLGSSPMIIANYSEHKDEAFQVLMEYISPENQLEMVQNGSSASVLSDPAILEQFAVDNEYYKNKNRAAWFTGEPALYEETQSRWDIFVDIDGALKKLAETDIDVNTLMRELEEESNAKIQEAMSQK